VKSKPTIVLKTFKLPTIVCEWPKAAHRTILSKKLSAFATFIHAKHICHIVCTPALCFRVSGTAGAANERFAFTLCLLCVRAPCTNAAAAPARAPQSRTALEIVPCARNAAPFVAH
jgi:hypothetical protein